MTENVGFPGALSSPEESLDTAHTEHLKDYAPSCIGMVMDTEF